MIFAIDTTGAFFSNDANLILAACVVILGGVVIYIFREYRAALREISAIQEKRILDAQSTSSKLTEPLEKQTSLVQRVYDLLISIDKNRGS